MGAPTRPVLINVKAVVAREVPELIMRGVKGSAPRVARRSIPRTASTRAREV